MSDPRLVEQSLRDARPRSGWLDDPIRPPATEPLVGARSADLVVVGGGFAGLWTAVLAKQRRPDLDVVVLEGASVGGAASGRNGGFVSTSLTHGIPNGLRHFADELSQLVELGQRNFRELEADVGEHRIDCDLERRSTLCVASQPWHVSALGPLCDELTAHGLRAAVWDAAQLREQVVSPTFLGAVVNHDDGGLVNPARLAWGLMRVAKDTGVRFHERSPVVDLRDHGFFVSAVTRQGEVSAQRAVLATNGFRPLLRRDRPYVAPVYNYALMTEPLDPNQRLAVGWEARQGLFGMEAEFHYYRLTADDRILWGGPHTDYMFGGSISRRHEDRPEVYAMLAHSFFDTFPQLEGLAFSHRWGGVIDVSSRATPFWDTAMGGKVATALGFSGLGVASTRFAAQVMLDLLDGDETERTSLRMVRRRPLPFPPEPLRSLGIHVTKRSIGAIDRNGGHRNTWLRALDRVGLGFDG